tara:strand:+ start:1474 stop:2049 length:576 start_codon:yes stop_codon:yes gene_type:complete
MEMNKLTDYIVIQDNLFEDNVSNKFEEIVKSDFLEFNKAGVTNDGQNVLDENIRKTEFFSLNNYEGKLTTINLCNLIGVSFGTLIDFYAQKTDTSSGSIIQNMQILKYNKNGFYKTHVDHGPATPRTLSIVYFINEDYEGGNLIFELPNKNYLKVEKKRNRGIIWPSNFLYPHKVEPVKEGVKYSIVSWTL